MIYFEVKMKSFLTDKEITGQETVTMDNKYIDSKDYTHCCRILKKSRLDSADIVYAMDLEFRVKTRVNILMVLIRKASQELKINSYKMLDIIIKKEDVISLGYKKYRNCLSREEHLDVLSVMMHSLKEYSNVKLVSNNTTEELLSYYNTFEYLKYQ
jgi:hypothetical protein